MKENKRIPVGVWIKRKKESERERERASSDVDFLTLPCENKKNKCHI